MNNTSTLGVGWIKKNTMGNIIKNNNIAFDNMKNTLRILFDNNITDVKIKNFSRFDNSSKKIVAAIALALDDANIKNNDDIEKISITRYSNIGANETNLNYFKDYIDSGRTLARGNLFIYTLPTSPLAEATVAFGIRGNILYSSPLSNNIQENAELALKSLQFDNNIKYNVIVLDDTEYAICIIVDKNSAFQLGKGLHKMSSDILCDIACYVN